MHRQSPPQQCPATNLPSVLYLWSYRLRTLADQIRYSCLPSSPTDRKFYAILLPKFRFGPTGN